VSDQPKVAGGVDDDVLFDPRLPSDRVQREEDLMQFRIKSSSR